MGPPALPFRADGMPPKAAHGARGRREEEADDDDEEWEDEGEWEGEWQEGEEECLVSGRKG